MSRILHPIAALATALLIAAAPRGSADTPPAFDLLPQTHFSQGWNLRGLYMVQKLGATAVRDGVFWRQIETAPGQYDMSSITPYMTAARAAGIEVLLVFTGTHPAHDDGNTPYTDAGRLAHARYIAAVAAAFPDVITTIEIGNEYNTDSFLVGPVRESPGEYFGPMIAAVTKEVRAVRPDVTILCTGAHSVATGYLRDVFDSGALPFCDGISFHPYRDQPEHVDAEISRLKALIRDYDTEKPLYATEFGKWFEDKANAPDYMLKMMALMGAAGVERAVWYALYDEDFWPNMGLYRTYDAENPAAPAFRFLRTRLLPLGRPVARGTRAEDQLFEFGTEGRAFVAWGAPGRLLVTGEARYFDSSGREIAPVSRLGPAPVVIMGEGLSVRIERPVPLYDAFLGYGAAPWSYLATAPGRDPVPFQVMDWNWNPYWGHPTLNPMKVTPVLVAAARFGGQPYHVVERFTAPQDGVYDVRARWFREKPHRDGADIRISLNGGELARGAVRADPFDWQRGDLVLKAGDRLDFAVGPNAEEGGDYLRREIRVTGPKGR